MSYSGWELKQNSKKQILNLFGQAHPDLIANHITYMFGEDSKLPPEAKIFIVGHCITDKIECFIAEVNGTIRRKDDKIYHLTWSLDKSKGAKPFDSNAAIENNGFEHLENLIEIYTEPKIFNF